MIIIINGSLGVGKTTVAEHLQGKFDQSVYLDKEVDTTRLRSQEAVAVIWQDVYRL